MVYKNSHNNLIFLILSSLQFKFIIIYLINIKYNNTSNTIHIDVYVIHLQYTIYYLYILVSVALRTSNFELILIINNY